VIHVLSGAALKYNPATLLVSELLSIVIVGHDYDVMLSIVGHDNDDDAIDSLVVIMEHDYMMMMMLSIVLL
jgi:hypothetical protein